MTRQQRTFLLYYLLIIGCVFILMGCATASPKDPPVELA